MSEQQWQMPELLTAWQAVNRTPMVPAAADAIEEALIAANYRIAELTADPWTYITADPATLPPHNEGRWLARRHEDGRIETIEGERVRNGFNDETPAYHAWFGYLEHYEIYAHSVIVIPEPPPYPGDETP